MYYAVYFSNKPIEMFDFIKYDTWSVAVQDLWTHKKVADKITLMERTNSGKLIPKEVFIYNEEKKGYRPIEPIEWE